MFHPGQEIKLSPKLAEGLGAELCGYVQDLEDDHKPLFNDYDVYRDWYEARPFQKRRNSPFPGASNIVVPLIQVAVDNLVTRHFFKLHTPRRTWVGSTENENWKEFADPVVDHLNWEARHTYDIRLPTIDWLHDGLNLGQAYLGLRYESRYGHRFVPGARGQRALRRILLSRGPVIDFIPPEQLLKHRDLPLQDSDIVVRQSLMTWNDLVVRTQHPTAPWDPDAVVGSEHFAGVDGITQKLLRGNREREGVRPSDQGDLHDVRQAWVNWSSIQVLGRSAGFDADRELKADPKDIPVPLVVTFHRLSRQILRVTAHPYFFSHWPFYEVNFRRRPGRGNGAGIAKRLEHMQRSASTSVNQAHDAVTISNSIRFVTTNPELARRRYRPEEPILVGNLSSQAPEIMFPALPKIITPDLAMVNLSERIAERQTGVTDPTSGRETRMGGHPAPATTTLTLLETAETQSAIALLLARKGMSQVGEDILTLYQQFDTDENGRLTRIHGAEDAEKMRAFFFPQDPEGFLEPVAGNLNMDIFALSETLNPDAERQRTIVVSQMTQNYFANLTRLTMLMADPRVDPLTKQVALQSMQSLTESQKRFLESSDIDDIESYIMKVQDDRAQDQQLLGGLLTQLQDAAAGQPAGPPAGAAPLAGLAGVPGNGAAGPPGVAGAPGGARL